MTNDLNAQRHHFLLGGAVVLGSGLLPLPVFAAAPMKVGLIIPISGPFASTSRQVEAAVKLY